MKRVTTICQVIAITMSSMTLVYAQTQKQPSQFETPTDPRPVQNPKLQAQYRERFALYNRKIDEAAAAGKLTDDEAMSYKTQVYMMQRLAVQTDRDSYDSKDVAHLNRKLVKFQNALPAIEARKPKVKSESDATAAK